MSRVFYSHIPDNFDQNLQNSRSYKCIIPYSNTNSELLLSRVLSKLLNDNFQNNIHDVVEFVLNELVTNSSKAIGKRVYFNVNNLDINSDENYLKGMKTFIDDYDSNFSNYEPEFKKNNHYIKITIEIEDNKLSITIINSCELLKSEKENIQNSFELAANFKSINDVFNHNFDSLEGVGYGLVLSILMLKKIDIAPENISFESSSGLTTTKLTIPLNLISDDQGSIIANEIVSEIDSLPKFPESILRLQSQLQDPECNFKGITDLVISDPALSAEILRIANSPLYVGKNRIENVSDAVIRIGLEGLNSILYSYGSSKILETRYNSDMIKKINEHLFNVGLISSYLASYRKLDCFSEDIFVAALLHDIGKIIVNSLKPELIDRVEQLCLKKNIPVSVLNNLSKGYNHTIIGAELAKKWNFPEKYINSILYHHNPNRDKGYYKSITYCVYMGNEISHYLNNGRSMAQIDEKILTFFKINEQESFQMFIKQLKKEGLVL